jgi:hypothetical protein
MAKNLPLLVREQVPIAPALGLFALRRFIYAG